MTLLKLECTLLQNFEALMALTNLAGVSEMLRSVAARPLASVLSVSVTA